MHPGSNRRSPSQAEGREVERKGEQPAARQADQIVGRNHHRRQDSMSRTTLQRSCSDCRHPIGQNIHRGDQEHGRGMLQHTGVGREQMRPLLPKREYQDAEHGHDHQPQDSRHFGRVFGGPRPPGPELVAHAGVRGGAEAERHHEADRVRVGRHGHGRQTQICIRQGAGHENSDLRGPPLRDHEEVRQGQAQEWAPLPQGLLGEALPRRAQLGAQEVLRPEDHPQHQKHIRQRRCDRCSLEAQAKRMHQAPTQRKINRGVDEPASSAGTGHTLRSQPILQALRHQITEHARQEKGEVPSGQGTDGWILADQRQQRSRVEPHQSDGAEHECAQQEAALQAQGHLLKVIATKGLPSGSLQSASHSNQNAIPGHRPRSESSEGHRRQQHSHR
mmetsp:Transcript_61868/g.200488  ORF Transcript_61868/g.200488 Transcript_61868/m.200488 type:complete len:389 (-) Transcript_61868:79-1245(-)